MRVRLVDLDHSAALIDQRPGQSRTERPGGLDTDRCDRAERREPPVGRAAAGTGRRERFCAQYSPERVERRGDTEVGVAVNPADHRLLWVWHAVVGRLGAAVPGRDGHDSDEASVCAGSYEVTSLVADRPQLTSPRSGPATSTRPRQRTRNAQGQLALIVHESGGFGCVSPRKSPSDLRRCVLSKHVIGSSGGHLRGET